MLSFDEKAQEVIFPSKAKAFYLYGQEDYVLTDEDIEELAACDIDGPMRVDLEQILAPLSFGVHLSRKLLLTLFAQMKTRKLHGLATSIAHTKNSALAAVMPTLHLEIPTLAAGLGVDLESCQRRISEAALKRITIAEYEKKMKALHLWCLKEASYKAHPNNAHLLLSDFAIIEWQRDGGRSECLKTRKTFELKILEQNDHYLCFARAL